MTAGGQAAGKTGYHSVSSASPDAVQTRLDGPGASPSRPVDLRDGAGTEPARGATPVAPLARCLLAAIDRYRARVAPTCSLCRTDPQRSFSYRVRVRVVERGVTAGLLMLAWGWLATHLGPRDTYGWRSGGVTLGRFERGGW